MKYYTQHDISLGELRLKMGKAVEPELAAAILGYGIKMDGPAGSGGVSIPDIVGPDAALGQRKADISGAEQEALQRILRHPVTASVLNEVARERIRQDARWGQQNHPSFDPRLDALFAPSRGPFYGVRSERAAREACESAFREGCGTYAHIFVEEVAEAIDATDEGRLREELVQCAAVAVAWIEAIDRRKAAGSVDKHLNGGW